MAKRVGLLQIRGGPEAEQHELECVRESAGLGEKHLEAHNVVDRRALDWTELHGIDALIIGGSGDHSVTQDYAFTPWLEDLVLRAVDDGTPVFGICWGHHFLGRIFGGRVVTDPARKEVGTFDVELNAVGLNDPLFHGHPPRFGAQLVHHDAIIDLPAGFIELGHSSACPHQVIRMVDRPVYGSQFHGEMTHEQLRQRLLMYRDEYLEGEDHLQTLVDGLRPTPEAHGVLRRFLELYT